MSNDPLAIIFVSNGPGEITTWVKPLAQELHKQIPLRPKASGSSISLNLVLDVPTDKRDFFGNVIYDQTSQLISTGMRKINVKDLPENGKPDSFTGAVGQFEFDVILNKKSLRATESFQAELKVKGNGNLKLFDLPNMLVPNSMELFEPEREESILSLIHI